MEPKVADDKTATLKAACASRHRVLLSQLGGCVIETEIAGGYPLPSGWIMLYREGV